MSDNENMFEQKVFNIKFLKSLTKKKIKDANFGNIARYIYTGAESIIVSTADDKDKEKDFIRTLLKKDYPFMKVIVKWKSIDSHSKSAAMNVDTFYFITLIDKYNKILTQSEITDFINEIADFTDNNSIDNVFARMSYNHIHENIETGYVNTVIDCSICKFKEDNAVEIIENGVIPKLEDAYLENIFTVFLWNKYQINNDIDVDVYCYGNIPITSAFGNYGQMFYI